MTYVINTVNAELYLKEIIKTVKLRKIILLCKVFIYEPFINFTVFIISQGYNAFTVMMAISSHTSAPNFIISQ